METERTQRTDSTSQATLSVIIPCFNVDRYVSRCLDSLLRDPLEHLEIICIDDGSGDETLRKLRCYETAHPETIRVFSQHNQGAWHARLNGINRATGKYISFVDADDTVKPGFTKKLYYTAVSTEADLVVCGFQRVDSLTGKTVSKEYCSPRRDFILSKTPEQIIEINPAPWNKAFRATLLKHLPSLKTTPIMFDDLALLQLFFSRAMGRVVFLEDCLVNYGVRSDSLINSVEIQQIDQATETLIEIRRIFEESDCSTRAVEALSVVAFLHLGISLLFRVSEGDASFQQVKQLEQSIRANLDTYFPEWRRTKYLSLRHAATHGSTMLKLWISSIFFKFNMMAGFLELYSSLVHAIGRDIKW